MRKPNKDAFAIVIPIAELKTAPFYTPLASTICQLFGNDEIFHARSKVWEGVNQTPKGIFHGFRGNWEFLKTDLSREELVNKIEQFYRHNAIQLK